MSVISTVITHRELIEELVKRDIKARYKQSVLGVAWAILNPLLTSLIQMLFIVYVLKRQSPNGIPTPVYTYFGTLIWVFFSAGLAGATESLVAHLSLITKIYFPREVFPIAAVTGKVTDLLFGLAGLLPLLLIFRVLPAPTIVLIVPLIIVLMLFTMGLGMLFACANLFYRDVRHLIGLIMVLWSYLVPNMYTLDDVPERFHAIYLLNPVAVIIDSARRLAFSVPGRDPDVHWMYVGIASVLSLIVFVVGYSVFKRFEPRFAESI